MLAGIGFDLGTIQRDMLKVEQPCPPAQIENLNEQLDETLQMTQTKFVDTPDIKGLNDIHDPEDDVTLIKGISHGLRKEQN